MDKVAIIYDRKIQSLLATHTSFRLADDCATKSHISPGCGWRIHALVIPRVAWLNLRCHVPN